MTYATHHQQVPLPYDSRQIANWFIRHAEKHGRSMSLMQALKLVYMAHGWCLAVLGRPLIQDRIEAWDYGPVIPAIYHAFRPKGIYNIQPWEMFERPMESQIQSFLPKVYSLYGEDSASELSRLTHIKDGPWDKVYRRGKKFQPISDESIAEHYKDKLERAKNG